MGCLCSRELCSTKSYTVKITTGDRPKKGHSANLFIILHGEAETTTRHQLDLCFTCFKRGQVDSFSFDDIEVGTISYIEFWQDTAFKDTNWYINSITVTNNQTNQTLPFPVFQRVRHFVRYKIRPYDTSLPQEVHGEWKESRQKELEWKRQEYLVVDSYTERKLPWNEEFSFVYEFDTLVKTTIKDTLKNVILKRGQWNSIADVKGIFGCCFYDRPSEMNRWNNDELFGAQRLRGTNPMQIKLCTEIPANFALNTEELETFLEGQSFQNAMNAKKIFIIDYEGLKHCPTKIGLTVCAPIALFYLRRDGTLVPIAIQLFQEKSDNNPVFMPSDPKYTWIMAKMWFNNADAQVHEAVAHLGFTHLIMEDILITVNRNISPSHPVYKLLAPHFLYLMAINDLARKLLISPKGQIDEVMTVGAEGVKHMYTHARKDWKMDVDGTLPENLKLRGLLDESVLPNYPSRDDAMELYSVIHRYVSEYVNLYYTADEMIVADDEIQAWRVEMEKPVQEGGYDIKGVPGENGRFTTREQLVIALTSFIHICSVDHAMVNFLQYDEYAFPLNYPSMLTGSPPRDKRPLMETDIVYTLPGKMEVLTMLNLAKVLSTRATKSLGDFEVNYIFDPKAQGIVHQFKQSLTAVGNIIQGRNRNRILPYDTLLPKYVPNAISI